MRDLKGLTALWFTTSFSWDELKSMSDFELNWTAKNNLNETVEYESCTDY